MTTIVTRNSKGAALTHGELDGNFSRASQAKAGNYTVVLGDNRDTIEFTATATVTLPDALTIAGASATGDFKVTIKNLVGITTITRLTPADTIDGVTADVVMTGIDSVTLKLNQAGDGYNIVSGGLSIAGRVIESPVLNSPEINSPVTGDGIDIDPTLAADSDTIIVSQKAIKAFVVNNTAFNIIASPLLLLTQTANNTIQTITLSPVTYPGIAWATIRVTGSASGTGTNFSGSALVYGIVYNASTTNMEVASANVANPSGTSNSFNVSYAGGFTIPVDASGRFQVRTNLSGVLSSLSTKYLLAAWGK